MGTNKTRIAILSGKGGTGKTLVSVNLAAATGQCAYVDCDVEEPNGHLFLKPEIVYERDIKVLIPSVDTDKCTGCRKCVEICAFNALAYVKGRIKVFEEICHNCAGCSLLCPEKAISEREKTVGIINYGKSEQISVYTGIMNTGEASGIPIIKGLLEDIHNIEFPVFIDCPPGSACIVMESIKDADYCVLVAEPTVFGVHNLEMVVELVRLFGKQFGVFLNKCVDGENSADEYCIVNGIPVIGRIYYDDELGRINSSGKIAARENNNYKRLFTSLLDEIKGRVKV